MFDIKELIQYHVDMHVHSNPDCSPLHPQHASNEDVVKLCHDAGMHGFVLKTHMWPAVGLAKKLNEMYDDFTVYPSVSLNLTAGGPYPWVMDMAIKNGARFVWLPTWSSINDKKCAGGFTQLVINEKSNEYLQDIPDEQFYTVCDENGELKDNIKKIIEMAKEANIVLGTGHGTTEEALQVMRYANSIGYKKVVFTHPACNLDAYSMDQLKEFAQLGGVIELTTLCVQPEINTMTPQLWKETCEACGYDHCMLSSDQFFDWTPPIPVQYEKLMHDMYDLGCTMEQLKTMAQVPLNLIEK